MDAIKSTKKTAKYEVVKNHLLAKIESGELAPGDKVPTEQELADFFSVSVTTTRKALLDLARDGIICRIKKKGTFVSEEKTITQPSQSPLKMVSFILPLNEKSDNNLLHFVRGAQEYLTDCGYSMLIEATNAEIKLENQLMKQAVEKNLSGLLIFPTNPEENADSFFKLRQKGIPFVLIDRYPENLPFNSVVCDNFGGAFQTTEHLIELGHKKILFITHVGSNQAEIVRHKGYAQAMKAHGLTDDFPTLSHEQTAEIAEKIRTEQFTALVCANDYCALELLKYLSDEGFSVPNEVAITGFDGQKATEYITPPLTTVIQPYFEIGQTAAKLLVDIMENSHQQIEHTVLPVSLDIRESTSSI